MSTRSGSAPLSHARARNRSSRPEVEFGREGDRDDRVSMLAASIWPSDRLDDVERTKAVRAAAASARTAARRLRVDRHPVARAHHPHRIARHDELRVGPHGAGRGDDIAQPRSTRTTRPGTRPWAAYGANWPPSPRPTRTGPADAKRRKPEEKRKTRGNPSKGGPGTRARKRGSETGRSAGDHRDENDEPLNLGDTQHRDSHQCPHLLLLNAPTPAPQRHVTTTAPDDAHPNRTPHTTARQLPGPTEARSHAARTNPPSAA